MDSVIEKCGERHGGARRGVGGWARVTAVGVASSEEKGGQARTPLFGFVFSSSNSGRVQIELKFFFNRILLI